MPLKSRKIINIISAIVIVLFLLFLCVQVVVYAVKVMSTGEVSPTAKMPFYPFIFMAALGIFVLSLIEFIKIVKGVGQECQQK